MPDQEMPEQQLPDQEMPEQPVVHKSTPEQLLPVEKRKTPENAKVQDSEECEYQWVIEQLDAIKFEVEEDLKQVKDNAIKVRN